jgi:hypothetical protein
LAKDKHDSDADNDSDLESLGSESSGELAFLTTSGEYALMANVIEDHETEENDNDTIGYKFYYWPNEEQERVYYFRCVLKTTARKKGIRKVDEWVNAVTRKFYDINVKTATEIVKNIYCINEKLYRINELPMYRETLNLMLDKETDIILDQLSPTLDEVLEEIAEKLGFERNGRWFQKVKSKYIDVGITSVEELLKNYFEINRLLRSKNYVEMFKSTRQTMHTTAVEIIEKHRAKDREEWFREEEEFERQCTESEPNFLAYHVQDMPGDDSLILEDYDEKDEYKQIIEQRSLKIHINNYIYSKALSLTYMNESSLIKYSMEKDENSLNTNIDFIMKNDLMFRIISHLSYINAFKHEPEHIINYDLSFLCLWLLNKENFPMIREEPQYIDDEHIYISCCKCESDEELEDLDD